MNDVRQRGKQRIVRTVVTAEKATHDPRSAQARHPRARRTSATASVGRANADMSGAARIPGALESTCASPCGNTIKSPSCRRIGSFPTACPQHVPRAIKWYSITRCAPGITFAAISRDGGASATQGELSSKSKYTEPVSLTARSTSERTSTFTRTLQAEDRACDSDARAGPLHFRTNREANRTPSHAVDPARSVIPDMPHDGVAAVIRRTSL